MKLELKDNRIVIRLNIKDAGSVSIGGNGNWHIGGVDTGIKAAGADGREVELKKSSTHVQWKYVDGTEWTDLVPLSELNGEDGITPTIGASGNWYVGEFDTGVKATGDDGREVEFAKSETHLVWKYTDDIEWTDLIALSLLKGEKGDPYVFEQIILAGRSTLLDEYSNVVMLFTANYPITLTIPPGLGIRQRYQGKQLGTGQITFIAGEDVILHTAPEEVLKTSGQYSSFQIDWIGPDEYHIYGRLELI